MTSAGPYVPYTLETVQDRSYPLADEIYAYFDRDPAKPINPLVHERLPTFMLRPNVLWPEISWI